MGWSSRAWVRGLVDERERGRATASGLGTGVVGNVPRDMLKVSDFDYALPRELIAQYPAEPRDASRLLVVERRDGRLEDHRFAELPELLVGNEVLIVNTARVIPARLFGRRMGIHARPVGKRGRLKKQHLAAEIEVLLTRKLEDETWEGLVRPGRKVRTGEVLVFEGGALQATIVGRGLFGVRRLRFSGPDPVGAVIERAGHVPLPPYIGRPDQPEDRDWYQTIFGREGAAVAAPTAGLHFTPDVVERAKARGVQFGEVLLEVGLGTFQPVRVENVPEHQMQSERYSVPQETAELLCQARGEGRRILAVGTTVVRALEDAASKVGRSPTQGSHEVVRAGAGEAEIFIYPGYKFQVVDQLLTNFHLPCSTLLMLVAAFAGREVMLRAYQHAVESRYRFYSYGDCMLIR